MNGTRWQRILRDGEECSLDPRGLSEIGRMARASELTVAQAVAAHKVAEIYGRYEAIVGLRRSAKSCSYELGFGNFGLAEDLLTPEQRASRDRDEIEAKGRFDEIQDELSTLPRALRDAIETLCVEDRHVLPIYYDGIRCFLGRMAIGWKITNKKARGIHVARARQSGITAQAQVVSKIDEPARPKTNIERVALLRFVRSLRPDLRGDDLHSSYDLYRALKDQTAHRLKVDRRRAEIGDGPAYEPPAEITPTAVITDRPVLTLPGDKEHA